MLGPPASFASEIETVEMYALFQSEGRPEDSQASLAERLNERLKSLPLVWFKRKKRLFEVAYFSRISHAEDILERDR